MFLSMAFAALVIDDECQDALSEWIKHVAKFAGICPPQIYLDLNPEINAMAGDGIVIVNSALIENCKDVEEFLGVLTHEMAHIARMHGILRDTQLKQSLLAGAATAFLGTAMGILTGSNELIIAGMGAGSHIFERKILRFSREQEQSADQYGLLYLQRMGFSGKGMLNFLARLKEPAYLQNSYAQTHPLSQERIRFLQSKITTKNANPNLQRWNQQFFRLKQKSLFWNKKIFPATDTYSEALLAYNKGQLQQSRELLIKCNHTPYSLELLGQIEFELKDYTKAIFFLKESVKKNPKGQSNRLILAQVYLACKEASAAISLLRSLLDQYSYPILWKLLATGYGIQGNTANQSWALGKMHLEMGNMAAAKIYAQKCSGTIDPKIQDFVLETKNYNDSQKGEQ